MNRETKKVWKKFTLVLFKKFKETVLKPFQLEIRFVLIIHDFSQKMFFIFLNLLLHQSKCDTEFLDPQKAADSIYQVIHTNFSFFDIFFSKETKLSGNLTLIQYIYNNQNQTERTKTMEHYLVSMPNITLHEDIVQFSLQHRKKLFSEVYNENKTSKIKLLMYKYKETILKFLPWIEGSMTAIGFGCWFLLGFHPVGVAAGGIAAFWQHIIGNVARHSLFAYLTHLGMVGTFVKMTVIGITLTASSLAYKQYIDKTPFTPIGDIEFIRNIIATNQNPDNILGLFYSRDTQQVVDTISNFTNLYPDQNLHQLIMNYTLEFTLNEFRDVYVQ